MYTFSTATFVSILALASSLAVVVRAGNPRVQCLGRQSVPTGITSWTSLADAFLTTKDELLSINPGQTCEEIIESGTLCTYGHFPTCKTKVTAGSEDTNCDGMVAANDITKEDFYAYNDDVHHDDCSDVVPGHKYCVAVYDDVD